MIPGVVERQRNRIKFRFVTQSRWISGYVSTVHRRLIDVLNSEHSGILMAEDVSSRFYLDTHSEPEIVAFADVYIPAILFAVPMDEEKDVMPRDPYVWVKKRPQHVSIAVGPYDLSGSMFLPEEYRMRDVFPAMSDRFIALTNVSVRRTDDLTFNEEYKVAFANRERLELISQQR